MKFKLTMLAMLAAIATEASADTLLLNCKITKAEGGNPYEWFANPPTNEADLAQALWNSGLVVFASPPPHRWQIDLQTGDFREPGAKLAYWKPAQIDQENIFASYRPLDGSRTLLMYNRQSHTMRDRKSVV